MIAVKHNALIYVKKIEIALVASHWWNGPPSVRKDQIGHSPGASWLPRNRMLTIALTPSRHGRIIKPGGV